VLERFPAKLAYDTDTKQEFRLFSWLDRFQGLGAFVMRVALGVIMVAHGYTKIIPKDALYNFSHMVVRMHLPLWLGYVSAFTEFFGGMLLIVGLLTRVAAFMTAIDMAVAIIKVHLHGGLLGPNTFALPLALFSIALMLVFTGCGWLGLDDFVGRNRGVRTKVAGR
jgi:putative oxidoreductase